MKKLLLIALLCAGAARAEPIGNSTCNAGAGTLSQDVYTTWIADTARNGFSGSMTSTQQAMICSQVWAFVQFMTNLPQQSGPQTITNSTAGTTPNVTLTLNSGDATPQFLDFYNNLALSDYNPLVLAGDNAIIFSSGTIGAGALDIAPWASSASGIRITTSSVNVTDTMNVTGTTNLTGAALINSHLSGNTTTPTLELESNDSSNQFMNFVSNISSGAYNGVVQAGDEAIIFGIPGAGNSGVITIAPYSSTATGIRLTYNGSLTLTTPLGTTITGPLALSSSQNHGTCTLNGASPSTCTATVPASTSNCSLGAVGSATLTNGWNTYSIAGTTMTVHGPNAATYAVSYICF